MVDKNKSEDKKPADDPGAETVMTEEELNKRIEDGVTAGVEKHLAAQKETEDEEDKKEDKSFNIFKTAVSDADTEKYLGDYENAKDGVEGAKARCSLGKLIQLSVVLSKDYQKGMQLAEKAAKSMPYLAKALNTGDLVSGGVLIVEEVANDVIELLRPLTTVRQFSRNRRIPTGSFRQARATAGAVSRYKGEGTTTNASQQTFDQIVPTPRFLETLVPISDFLLDFTNSRAQAEAQSDMMDSMAQREDLAFLRGLGTQFEPKGLLNFADTTTNETSAAVADVRTDIRTTIEAIRGSNVAETAMRWLMTSRSFGFLEDLKTAGGETNEFTLAANGNIRGIPVTFTNNIPNNLGGGGDESEIYLVDFAEIVIFDAIDSFRLRVSNEATYVDSGGNDRSAFANDETIMKMISAHDLIPRHNEAIAVIDQITYGQ